MAPRPACLTAALEAVLHHIAWQALVRARLVTPAPSTRRGFFMPRRRP